MNPLQSLFEAGLSGVDVGVMQHGFAEQGRDYVFIIEDRLRSRPGTYRLTFTHVVELSAKTAISPEAWGRSWSNDFTDDQRWQPAGEPDGYVFGTKWSLDYPGFAAINDSPLAARWANKLGRPMFAASLQTDLFEISLVFHDAQLELVREGTATVSQVIFPIE